MSWNATATTCITIWSDSGHIWLLHVVLRYKWKDDKMGHTKSITWMTLVHLKFFHISQDFIFQKKATIFANREGGFKALCSRLHTMTWLLPWHDYCPADRVLHLEENCKPFIKNALLYVSASGPLLHNKRLQSISEEYHFLCTKCVVWYLIRWFSILDIVQNNWIYLKLDGAPLAESLL